MGTTGQTRAQERRIRFGAGGPRDGKPEALLAAARRAEGLGYSTFWMPDHFGVPFSPLVGLQAVADATTHLRVAQLVLAEGFRHPAVVAKDLATLDVFSGGRVEVGIGAGWDRAEFDRAGIPFGDGSARLARLEEAVVVLKGLFGDEPCSFSGEYFTIDGLDGLPKPAQRPRPPILIGGGGAKLLAVAGRHADIVQVLPGAVQARGGLSPFALTAEAYREKVDRVRDAAGDRFGDIELGALLVNVTITDDIDGALDAFVGRFPSLAEAEGGKAVSRDDLLSSPVVAIGSREQVCDKLLEVRDTFGFSYFGCPPSATPASLAPVIDRLAGA